MNTSFKHAFAEAFGIEELDLLTHAILNEPAPTSIRLNPRKAAWLSGAEVVPVPWCEEGGYLQERPLFMADPWWHAGAYYVQEAGSMFLSYILKETALSPRIALDLCAAPGGKSTLLRGALPFDTLLVANEIEASRANILAENISRFGADEVIVTSAAPERLVASGLRCDFILVDAPCSGEGMFRKEPKSVEEWNLSNIAMCVTRQRGILDSAWEMLEEGGVMVYSTCTYNLEENEEQLCYLKEHYPLEVLTFGHEPLAWGIQEGQEEGVYRFMPHHTASEGFTLFAVRKVGAPKSGKVTPEREKAKKGKQEVPLSLRSYFATLPYDHLITTPSGWTLLSSQGQTVLTQLQAGRIRILQAGVPLGEMKGRDFIPHPASVMSAKLAPNLMYPICKVDATTALAYLKREVVQIEGEKGFVQVAYRGLPIGFAKNIGSRANNMYPKSWAIRNTQITTADMPRSDRWIEIKHNDTSL